MNRALLIALTSMVLGAGCGSRWYVESADRESAAIVAEKTEAVLGGRESRVIRPEPATEEAATDDRTPAGDALKIDLDKALELAVKQNRDYLTRREGLSQSALSLALTRFGFTPQLGLTISHLWSDAETSDGAQASRADFSVSQILPTGGSLSFTTGIAGDWVHGEGGGIYTASAGLSLSQPLLRGAGYEVSHESLTQAERDMVYAIRSFELFRQDFSIRITQSYFDLVSQKQTLVNEQRNYDQARDDRRKAEVFRQLDRNTQEEVFRARRREIDAEDELIEARAAYDRALDAFKIELGLPTSSAIEIVDAQPPHEEVRLDLATSIVAARHNRLDIMTDRDRLEDAERAVRIAEDALLPDLALTAGYGLSGAAHGFPSPDEWSASVGITLEVPLQQKSERNSYRNSLYALAQARRGYDETLALLELDIRDQLRRLASDDKQIELQKEQIRQELRAVAVTQIRYDAGDLDNRDLLEARQSLTDAENALIKLKVSHFIRRLRLLRDLGLLFVDDNGKWK